MFTNLFRIGALLTGILLLKQHCLSQENKVLKWGVKFSYDILFTAIQKIYSNDSVSVLQENMKFYNFPLSFQIYHPTKLHYHELSLSRLELPIGSSSTIRYKKEIPDSLKMSNLEDTYSDFNIQIGVRYAFFLKLGKKEKKSQFYLEFPFELFYHRYEKRVFNLFDNGINTDAIGVNLGVTPHYQYFVLPNKLFFDFAVPLSLYNGIYSFSRTFDRNIGLVKGDYFSAFHYSGSPFISFRIGMGAKF